MVGRRRRYTFTSGVTTVLFHENGRRDSVTTTVNWPLWSGESHRPLFGTHRCVVTVPEPGCGVRISYVGSWRLDSERRDYNRSLFWSTDFGWIWCQFGGSHGYLHFSFSEWTSSHRNFLVSSLSWSRFWDRYVFRFHRRMGVYWRDRGVFTKNWSDFTDLIVCVLNLRLTVNSNNSKSSFNFVLDSFYSLGYFNTFSSFYFIDKILP